MIGKIILILIFSKLSNQEKNKQFLLKLTPEQVMQTFDGVMSDDYIKILAKDFAAKAAAHFMNEIRNQKKAMVEKLNSERASERYKSLPEETQDKVAQLVAAANQAANEAVNEAAKSELDEGEALRLLQAPSPDGDHLDSSGEFSDEKKKIPVIQLTKINGIYYRRLLGMI
ncbi:uncharacterized protein LOC142973397 [Anticarsia gemmatalis]|uniref:uncharacterized protein LOC142973397 n=1 Tax=Anticarsia gemmatalis TaxID=129554 RepID=UPI003F76F1E3